MMASTILDHWQTALGWRRKSQDLSCRRWSTWYLNHRTVTVNRLFVLGGGLDFRVNHN